MFYGDNITSDFRILGSFQKLNTNYSVKIYNSLMTSYYYFADSRKKTQVPTVQAIHGDETMFIHFTPLAMLGTFKKGDCLICYSDRELADGISDAPSVDDILHAYMQIYKKGIALKFDTSVQCNSDFIQQITSSDSDFENILLKCISNYEEYHAIEQIYLKQHMLTALANGRRVGLKKGTKLSSRKAVRIKNAIHKMSSDFNGSKSDKEIIEYLQISKNTYYKYKKELKTNTQN